MVAWFGVVMPVWRWVRRREAWFLDRGKRSMLAWLGECGGSMVVIVGTPQAMHLDGMYIAIVQDAIFSCYEEYQLAVI
jgi:hypothetical protein